MITHFTMDYNYKSCNSLIELLEKGYQNKQQKSVDIFNSKRDWYHNNNFAERKPKEANKKSNDNNVNRRTQIVEGKIDIEVVKIKTEPEVLVKKEQLTKGLHNKIRKTI